jgi:hypothetical protein
LCQFYIDWQISPFAGVVGVGVPPVVPPVVVVVFVSSGAVSSFFLQEKINALTNAMDNADFSNVDVFIVFYLLEFVL